MDDHQRFVMDLKDREWRYFRSNTELKRWTLDDLIDRVVEDTESYIAAVQDSANAEKHRG